MGEEFPELAAKLCGKGPVVSAAIKQFCDFAGINPRLPRAFARGAALPDKPFRQSDSRRIIPPTNAFFGKIRSNVRTLTVYHKTLLK